MSFKLAHDQSDCKTFSAGKDVQVSTRKENKNGFSEQREVSVKSWKKTTISCDRKKDLTSMLPYMPQLDRNTCYREKKGGGGGDVPL